MLTLSVKQLYALYTLEVLGYVRGDNSFELLAEDGLYDLSVGKLTQAAHAVFEEVQQSNMVVHPHDIQSWDEWRITIIKTFNHQNEADRQYIAQEFIGAE